VVSRPSPSQGQHELDELAGLEIRVLVSGRSVRVTCVTGLLRIDRVGRDRLWQIEAQQLTEIRLYLEQISARWDVTWSGFVRTSRMMGRATDAARPRK
jgi:hypothetical protein